MHQSYYYNQKEMNTCHTYKIANSKERTDRPFLLHLYSDLFSEKQHKVCLGSQSMDGLCTKEYNLSNTGVSDSNIWSLVLYFWHRNSMPGNPRLRLTFPSKSSRSLLTSIPSYRRLKSKELDSSAL